MDRRFEHLVKLEEYASQFSFPLDRIETSLEAITALADEFYENENWVGAINILSRIHDLGTKLIPAIPLPPEDQKPAPQVERVAVLLVQNANHLARTNTKLSSMYLRSGRSDGDSKLLLDKAKDATADAYDWAVKFNLGPDAWRQMGNDVQLTAMAAKDLPPKVAVGVLRKLLLTHNSIQESIERKLEVVAQPGELTLRELEAYHKGLIGSLNDQAQLLIDLAEIEEGLALSPLETKPLDFSIRMKSARSLLIEALNEHPDIPTNIGFERPAYVTSFATISSNLAITYILEGERQLKKIAKLPYGNFEYLEKIFEGFAEYAQRVVGVFTHIPQGYDEKRQYGSTTSFLHTETYCRFARMLVLIGKVKMLQEENKSVSMDTPNIGNQAIRVIKALTKTTQHLETPAEIFALAENLLASSLPKDPTEALDKDDQETYEKAAKLLTEATSNKTPNVV